jgi:hypothetical protein
MTREWKQNAWTPATFEDAREFKQIQKFAAACRRLWPGAKITLRPNEDDAPSGADARPRMPPKPHQE